jgi:hypothetical protein
MLILTAFELGSAFEGQLLTFIHYFFEAISAPGS